MSKKPQTGRSDTTPDIAKLIKQTKPPRPVPPPDWMIPRDADTIKPPKK